MVVAAGVWYVRSTDGGASWTTMDPIAAGDWMGTETLPHVDGHVFAWQGDSLWLGCDGGVWLSADAGSTWDGRNDGLVTRQYYGLDIDPIRHDRILGGTQDNKTNLRLGPGDDDWEWVLDGDGFDCAVNPLVPDLVYGTIYGTLVFRSIDGGFVWENISPTTGGDLTPFATPLIMRPGRAVAAVHRFEPGLGIDGRRDHLERPRHRGHGRRLVHRGVRAIAITPADHDPAAHRQGFGALHELGRRRVLAGLAHDQHLSTRVALSPLDPDLAVAGLARTPDGRAPARAHHRTAATPGTAPIPVCPRSPSRPCAGTRTTPISSSPAPMSVSTVRRTVV